MVRFFRALLLFWFLSASLGLSLRDASAAEEKNPPIPDYQDCLLFDPERSGGHLLPSQDRLIQGIRKNRPVQILTDSNGFRNDHEISRDVPDGTFRILFVGDSFVDGLRTDQKRTIGYLLEQKLNQAKPLPDFSRYEVVISGHNNPVNAWYYFERHGREFHPHLVLIGLTLGNDLSFNSFGDAFHVTRGPDGASSIAYTGEYRREKARLMDRFLPERAYQHPSILDGARNGVVRFLRGRTRSFRILENVIPPSMAPQFATRFHVPLADAQASLGLFYRPTLPHIDGLYRDLEITLDGFAHSVRQSSARPVVLFFPTRFEVSGWDRFLLRFFYSLDVKQFDTEYPRTRLTAVLDEKKIDWVDPTSELRRSDRLWARVFMPLGNMHLNDRGQAVVAEVLARAIIQELQAQTV